MSQAHLTAEVVRSLLDYDPETGLLTWRERTPDMFQGERRSPEVNCRWWNKRFSGTQAGTETIDGYIQLKLLGEKYYAHVLIWLHVTGVYPEQLIDHRDTCGIHNWWENLRDATHQQNSTNRSLSSINSTGYKGVHFYKPLQKYVSYITVGGKRIHLGYFNTAEEAHASYVRAAEFYFGEFARAA